MVGAGWLHPNLGGVEFWSKFPVKYNTVRNYERSKVIFAGIEVRRIKYNNIDIFFCFFFSFRSAVLPPK